MAIKTTKVTGRRRLRFVSLDAVLADAEYLAGVPTLLIHAEWDADLPSDQARGYFTKLVNAPYKRYIEIGEGTHTIIMEKNRMQFFREIMNFLDERDPQGVN